MASRKPNSTINNKSANTSGKRAATSSRAASSQRAGASKKATSAKRAASSPRTASGKNTGNVSAARKGSAAVQEPERESSNILTCSVIGLLFALLFELSNFDIFGKLGGWLKYGQFGLFGVMAYLFPMLVLAGFIMSAFEEKRRRLLVSSIFMFLFLCCFAHLLAPIPLDQASLTSFFEAGAVNYTGGGILGGALALVLYQFLSQTGAIILTVLVLLGCFYFLFRDPIRDIFAYFLYRENDEDAEEENWEESLHYRKKYVPDREEPIRKSVTVSSNPHQVLRQGVRTRKKAEEPIYITEDEEGTTIRIYRTRKVKGVEHNITLTRSKNKAQPLRDGTVDPIQGEKRVGVSNDLDLMPHNAGGDEMHEITRRGSRKIHTASENISSDAPEMVPEIKPAAIRPNRKEAAVTSVTQAAVNRRAKEAKPVKERREEKAAAQAEASIASKEQPKSAASSKVERTPQVFEPAEIRPTSSVYFAPPMELLSRVKGKSKSSEAELERIAQDLEVILEQFGVNATVTDIQAGPSVTRFELQPEIGTRVNKITSLADDLKLNLGVTEIRIEAPIPGRQAVGIEIPNKNRQTVYMRELLEEPSLINHPSKIAFAAGKDISGNVVVADIAKMPHLLVAGTTGSGKSVFLNTILMTILYRAKPSEVGLIIIDPKKVEFGIYAGIPHLMKDVVTDPGQAVSTLRWAVNEMTNRYQRMQLSAVRDFKSYNAKVEKGTVNPAEENPRKMNQIVIIIDELADLMMVAKKEAEALICRLAQLARAAGIHLIIATQRPSVDVVTGLIKANVPARVALLVSSQIDSRTIIDMPGAEKLLGNGDMLFYPTGYVKPVRIQGAFVSDDEIQKTVDYLIQNNQTDYFSAESQEIEKFMNSEPEGDSGSNADGSSGNESKYDDCFYEAGKMCIEMGKASSSMLQRRFNLGFNRAARIIDQLEEFGAVGPQNGAKPREILVDTMTFEEMYRAMMEQNKT